jgi:hypothetical protein
MQIHYRPLNLQGTARPNANGAIHRYGEGGR